MKITTFAPDQDFLQQLAQHVVMRYGQTPEALARVRIYLPHHRACRALAERFADVFPHGAGLLPQMFPLGEAQGGETEEDTEGTISPLHRRLLMARLLQQHTGKTLEQCLRLAACLTPLFDEVQREEARLERLHSLVMEEHFAEHWQEARDILLLITEQWPGIIAQTGLEEPIAQRNRLLAQLATQWREQPPETPILIAGSTGSQPAVRRLMQAALTLPKGEVILPALDLAMAEERWQNLTPTHAQWGLKQLMLSLGITREDVTLHGQRPTSNGQRLTSISSASLQEEAEIIARLCQQQFLRAEKKSVLIVTPHRNLSTRIEAELARFGILLQSSAARPLAHTPAATLLRLLAELLENRESVTHHLALLKHPLVMTPEHQTTVSLLERHALRGLVKIDWQDWLARTPLSPDQQAWLNPIAESLQGWHRQPKNISFAALLATHRNVAESISQGRIAGMQDWLEELATHAHTLGTVSPRHYPALFESLLGGESDPTPPLSHPQIQLLTPMEARLQQADVVILGGLNEGCWPALPAPDPWLNAAMRARLGLPPIASTLGQQAHDFESLAASHGEVILTRASKEDGSPTTHSRWWQMLEMQGRLTDESEQWKHWLHVSKTPSHTITLNAPLPCPPVAARPHRREGGLSVSDIGLLVRDPYALYAKHILRLRPLKPLDMDAGGADFGQIVHDVLLRYHTQYPTLLPEHRLSFLVDTGTRELRAFAGGTSLLHYWLPSFKRLAEQFLAWDEPRRASRISAEINGRIEVPMGDYTFTLRARADRIEQRDRHSLTIADYKTGSLPTSKHVTDLRAPQLPLEALIAARGGWEGIAPATDITLEYWPLKGRGEAEIKPYADGVMLAEKASEFLTGLLLSYDQPTTPYPTAENMRDAGDYGHLERLKEWKF